ncbi:MAG: glycosyltransferase family 4 protein [Microgenomates group bacterium]
MKIAVYYDGVLGGGSRAIEEILKILSTRHHIEIFNGPKPFTLPPFFQRIFVDFESLVSQYFKQKTLAKKIDSQKFDLVFVSHDFHPHAPWILRFLKTPSVFLCQEPTRAFYEKYLGIESALPLLNKIYENVNRFLRRRIEESNVRFANKVVTSSYCSAESIFRAYGVSSAVAYPGIDPLVYRQIKNKKKKQILIVGNHDLQKDLPFAIKAVSLIDKKIRPRLIIVSPRKANVSDLKKLAKLKHVDVTFFVGLDKNEMCKLYNQSLLTIATAHLEAFGLSIIESLACGTPVVAIKEAGFRETIVDCKTGLLVDRNNQQMANAIEELLKDKKKREDMGKRGIKDVNTRYTWDNTVEKLEKIFYETKKDKSSRRHC